MSGKFLRDGSLLFGAEIVSRLLAFSVSFVLARQVGLEALALLALTQSIVAYATVAGDAGLGTDAVRRIANGQDADDVVRETARVQILFAVLASSLAVPIAYWQTGSPVALSVGIVPVMVAASATYVLQGRLDAKNLAASRVIGNVVVGSLGITTSLMGATLWVIALSYGAGALASMAYVNWKAGVLPRDLLGRVEWNVFAAAKSKYFSLAAYTIVLHAYASCLIIMAQNLGGGGLLVDVALATRVQLLMVIPAQLLGSLLLPRYSSRLVRRKMINLHAAGAGLVGVVLSALVVLNANWFVPLLFGPEASQSVFAVQIISIQLPLSMISTVFVAYLLSVGQFRLLARHYVAALISQIVSGLFLNYYMTPYFVLSIVVSELVFVLLLLSSVKSRKRH